jgi:hypothetical protein
LPCMVAFGRPWATCLKGCLPCALAPSLPSFPSPLPSFGPSGLFLLLASRRRTGPWLGGMPFSAHATVCLLKLSELPAFQQHCASKAHHFFACRGAFLPSRCCQPAQDLVLRRQT